jgi:phage tail-like protein
MPVANPVNPRKKFSWSVEFDGLDAVLVQKLKIPTVSVDAVEHGVANILNKTAGMVKVGDLELTKLKFQNKNESWAWKWLMLSSNQETGQVGLPTDYKKNGYIIHYGPDGETVLEKWQVIGCWPKNIEIDELDKVSSDNMMEKVTLSCDQIVLA